MIKNKLDFLERAKGYVINSLGESNIQKVYEVLCKESALEEDEVDVHGVSALITYKVADNSYEIEYFVEDVYNCGTTAARFDIKEADKLREFCEYLVRGA